METKTVNVVLEIVNTIRYRKGMVVLQYITGHAKIPHQERVNLLAQQSAAQPQIDRPITQLGVKLWLKASFMKRWLAGWENGNTARVLYNKMPRPRKRDPWLELPRSCQSLITQMRTGHCPTNSYLHRLDKNREPGCRLCGMARRQWHIC